MHPWEFTHNLTWGGSVDQSQDTSPHHIEMTGWQLRTWRQCILFTLIITYYYNKSKIWGSRSFHLNIRKDKPTLSVKSKISPLLTHKKYHCSARPHGDPLLSPFPSFKQGVNIITFICTTAKVIWSYLFSMYMYRVINKANMITENAK